MEHALRVTSEAERDDAIEALERRREAVLSTARKLSEVEQRVLAFEERLKVRYPRPRAKLHTHVGMRTPYARCAAPRPQISVAAVGS